MTLSGRELHDQPAGLRTHVLLTIGACLFPLVSAYGFGGPAGLERLVDALAAVDDIDQVEWEH